MILTRDSYDLTLINIYPIYPIYPMIDFHGFARPVGRCFQETPGQGARSLEQQARSEDPEPRGVVDGGPRGFVLPNILGIVIPQERGIPKKTSINQPGSPKKHLYHL